MFDAFQQAKLQNAYHKLKDFKVPEKDTSLDDLKKLSGVRNTKTESVVVAGNKAQFMRENNIKPGTDAWFKLWFAKPDITGEDPFSK